MAEMREVRLTVEVDPVKLARLEEAEDRFREASKELHDSANAVREAMRELQDSLNVRQLPAGYLKP